MSVSWRSEVILQGDFYSGATSQRRPSELALNEGQLILTTDTDTWHLDWASVSVSPRIGNTPRYLHLPDDGVFETTDNDGVDALTRALRTGLVARWVHRLENHLGLIVVSALVAVLITAGTFLYGLPWASQAVAAMMPDSVVEQVSDATLHSLDTALMDPTTLSAERQSVLQDRFAPLLDTVSNRTVTVTFRSSDAVGANAMALPDGTIVFTDAMVNLAEDDNELVAVLAHELGHVAGNHGMEGVVHSSITGWLIVMMTGDLSAFADSAVVGPAVLVNLAYSRDMEREADQYALDLMQARGINPGYFVSIMQRMEPKASAEDIGEDDEADQDDGWLTTMGSLMSTHPMTQERIERFRQAATAQ